MGTCGGHMRRRLSVMAWIRLAFLGVILSFFIQGAICATEPSESECRPYIEKALKEQHQEGGDLAIENADFLTQQEESHEAKEITDEENLEDGNDDKSTENEADVEDTNEPVNDDNVDDDEDEKTEEQEADDDDDDDNDEGDDNRTGKKYDEDSTEKNEKEDSDADDDDNERKKEDENEGTDNGERVGDDVDLAGETQDDQGDDEEDKSTLENDFESLEKPIEIEVREIEIDESGDDDVVDDSETGEQKNNDRQEEDDKDLASVEIPIEMDEQMVEDDTKEEGTDETGSIEEDKPIKNGGEEDEESAENENQDEDVKGESKPEEVDESKELEKRQIEVSEAVNSKVENEEGGEPVTSDEQASAPEEEELTQEMVIPENLRPRDHIDKILKLDEEDSGLEKMLEKTMDSTLKSLKGLYDSAIKPLEMLYKYRDLSNRHFGDPEIFSKPLILFMGPWSGGKSSTINYLLNNEFSHTSLRTGAEPSPAYFNILMYGEEEEILDGTQLAADWTFSGLQKFGQGLLDRLKGVKLQNKLLEKVNVVEIPGILEIRKQVQRMFPFNDACQWFIDRADIIFLVYDPSKLDVGPETEAILDQLKGRESQTRIILNKADQVKPEELMRVQGTLIWNISPLMSSTEPPIMYSTSLWSMPYETGAPTRLLLAQERAFLRDLRDAIDKRVENKISSARRFAVRVRNHAKMVDCYLTTYYNHKSFFGNRKRIADDIIENPQKYHIYEGLSTLTNISRYDLPDPDVYHDFFKINPLYEFQKLSETCTYFRGCPINKLDVVIAYDLPELVGKYRKAVEGAKEQMQKENS